MFKPNGTSKVSFWWLKLKTAWNLRGPVKMIVLLMIYSHKIHKTALLWSLYSWYMFNKQTRPHYFNHHVYGYKIHKAHLQWLPKNSSYPISLYFIQEIYLCSKWASNSQDGRSRTLSGERWIKCSVAGGRRVYQMTDWTAREVF